MPGPQAYKVCQRDAFVKPPKYITTYIRTTGTGVMVALTRLSLTVRFLRAFIFVRKCAAKATSTSLLTETLGRCKQGAGLGIPHRSGGFSGDCYRAKSSVSFAVTV